MATSSLTAFSYEGILFALKSWNGSLVIVQAGLVANPEIPGHLFHCGYTANVYRVVESVVQLYTAGKSRFEELAELHNRLVRYTIRERGSIHPQPYCPTDDSDSTQHSVASDAPGGE